MKPTDALFESIYPKDSMLVIGLVAQVGANLDDLCSALRTRLEGKSYQVEVISLSHFLCGAGTTTEQKQSQGTLLRQRLRCHPALALCTAAAIRDKLGSDGERTKRAFVIRSLKRPEEVEALRIIYGEAFLSIGVHTPKSKRIHYLRDVKGDKNPEKTIECDENAANHYGQRTRDAFEMCDFFIKGVDPEFAGLDRALKLVFGSVFTTPTIDEYAMAMAYAASLRSADLSRQVGAAVVNASREVVASGSNEVPKFGGGQPWEHDEPDLRDFAELHHDPNVVERDDLIHSFLDSISPKLAQGELPFKERPEVKKCLKESGLLDITEFGRTVHAEMACLMSCLRNHVDIQGATLYSTTFPCHNCVRHILASGVTSVMYVEPYPKSRAQKLFQQSCSFWDDDFDESSGKALPKRNGLRIEPFIGIGPRKYHDLFSMKTFSGKRIERKTKDGKALPEATISLQDLKWPSSNFGAKEREERAVEQLVSLWEESLGGLFPEILRLLPKEMQKDDRWTKHRDEDPDHQIATEPAPNRPKRASRAKAKPTQTGRPIVNVEEGGKDQEQSKPAMG